MRKRILVVEDDAMQRDVLVAFLNDQRFYVETAVDGLDAIQRARLGWFDVILMDCRLPEVDGVAASRLITDLTRDHGSPKIIAVTGWPELARQSGNGTESLFFAVEPKPWEAASLLGRIGQAGCTGDDSTEDDPDADAAWPPARDDAMFAADEAPRILLVEDDDMPRALVAAALCAAGYHVDEARDGLEAVLKMGETAYDAAILDYALPKLNGAAAARLVQDLLTRADRPRLIALTANPGPMQDKIDGLAIAFDEIVGKSAGLGAVLAAVGRCAKRPTKIGGLCPPSLPLGPGTPDPHVLAEPARISLTP